MQHLADLDPRVYAACAVAIGTAAIVRRWRASPSEKRPSSASASIEVVDGREIFTKAGSTNVSLKKQLSGYYENMANDKSGFVEIESRHYPAYAASLPLLTDKVVAITGCTSGCGYRLARTCVEKQALVVMLNRKGRAALAEQKLAEHAKLHSAPPPVSIECDLTRFESVRAAGAELAKQFGRTGLDVLCNNAGIMGFTDDATEDGCDVQMQVNHTSHFLLTSLAMPLLEKAAALRGEARVVNHSSALRALDERGWSSELKQRYLEKRGGNLGGNNKTVGVPGGPNFQRYQQSKLANVVFTYALHDRLSEAGSRVKALVAHPGVAPTALHLNSAMGADAAESGWLMRALMRFFFKAMTQSEEDGTMGILMCSADPSAESGNFYGPYGKGLVGGKHDQAAYTGPATRMKFETLAHAEAREMLWRVSEEVTGASFTVSTVVGQTPSTEAAVSPFKRRS